MWAARSRLFGARAHPCVSAPGDLKTLIKHGLHALRDTLQQDKELTILNTSLGVVGPDQAFEIIEGADLQQHLDSMDPKEATEARGQGQNAATAMETD